MEDPERRSQVSARTVWTVGLNVIAMGLAVLFVYREREVLTWILVALFLAVAINPGVTWLMRRGIGRGLSVLIISVAIAGFFVLMGFILVPPLVQQVQGLVEAGPGLLDRLRGLHVLQWADERFGVVMRAREWLQEHGAATASSAIGFVTGFFKGLVALLTVLVLTIFMLVFGEEVFGQAVCAIEPSRRARYVALARRMEEAVGGYVAGVLIVAAIAGVVTALYLLVLGVPYFLPLAFLALVLDIVPYIGNTMTGLIVVPTAFAAAGTRTGIIVLIVFLIYQQVENHLVQPLVQRRTIKMNPLIIFLVLLLGTSLAGLLGALLALPVAGAVQVVLQDVMARGQAARGREDASGGCPPGDGGAPS
jgi:predicted PurR-regulated permease PerM